MRKLLSGTRKASGRGNQRGFIVSLELVFISTILVIGLIVGLVAIRDAMLAEMKDTADAINSIDNSYSYAGATYTIGGVVVASTAGSSFDDAIDITSGQGVNGVVNYQAPATSE